MTLLRKPPRTVYNAYGGSVPAVVGAAPTVGAVPISLEGEMVGKETNKKMATFRLSPDVREIIAQVAEAENVSQSVVIERAVRAYGNRLPGADFPELLTSAQVARMLNLTRMQVNEMAREGRLQAYNAGSPRQLFRRQDVEALLIPVHPPSHKERYQKVRSRKAASESQPADAAAAEKG
jgi:excisionase family DNA binding protein